MLILASVLLAGGIHNYQIMLKFGVKFILLSKKLRQGHYN